ncbi:hypothetical protein [Amycolatopsis sp. lyj-112]|uniref:hypothetical protein n=1 Tax=Amycolatopsis sp. lyj-112 TaxID=2789288 RepID=UPI003977F1E0
MTRAVASGLSRPPRRLDWRHPARLVVVRRRRDLPGPDTCCTVETLEKSRFADPDLPRLSNPRST